MVVALFFDFGSPLTPANRRMGNHGDIKMCMGRTLETNNIAYYRLLNFGGRLFSMGLLPRPRNLENIFILAILFTDRIGTLL